MQGSKVTLCSEFPREALVKICLRYRLVLNWVEVGQDIPGSFWKESEAGLIGRNIYVRADTPLHSLLHEMCHFVCMDGPRRNVLDTNAGGTAVEESAVCYLQVILSNHIAGYSAARMFKDMDAWGYSFRLGSTEAWFLADAEDGLAFLLDHALLTKDSTPTWQLRL